MSLQPATDLQLAEIDRNASAYRGMWASIDPKFPCDFNGDLVDIDALDFIVYEAGHHPNGVQGAGYVLGSVVTRTGVMDWLGDPDGNLLIGRHEYDRIAFWPFARSLEIENSPPQFGKYKRLLTQIVAEAIAIRVLDRDDELALATLVDPDCLRDYVARISDVPSLVDATPNVG